uniref:Putative rna-binding protein nob1p involved in 26s proteasome assembly n=1 Tax=Ixodes ricinus TaxID=34613 RepID=A0A0K8R7E7_IXORI
MMIKHARTFILRCHACLHFKDHDKASFVLAVATDPKRVSVSVDEDRNYRVLLRLNYEERQSTNLRYVVTRFYPVPTTRKATTQSTNEP